MSKQYDIIVVGAGFGGSTCAALLAKRGLKVLLLDKNPRAGGKAMAFSKGGFGYNPWMIIATPMKDNLFEAVLAKLEIEDRVKMVKLEEHGVIFHNSAGQYAPAPSIAAGGSMDPNLLFEWLEVRDEEREEAIRFFTELVTMSPKDIDELHDISFAELMGRYRLSKGLYSFLVFCSDGCFMVPVDVVAASEAVKSLQDVFLRGGAVFCKGGIGRIAEAIAGSVEANGGTVSMGTRAQKIAIKDGRISGVVTDKGDFSAPIVVSNAGIQATVLKLVGESHFDKGYVNYVKELVPSWGMMGARYLLNRKVIKPSHGAIFFADAPWNMERWLKSQAGNIPDEFPIWYEVPSNYDPGAAPQDKQLVLTGFWCPADPKLSQDQVKAWQEKGEKIIFKAFPDLPASIESREYYTARDVSGLSRDQVLPYQGGECIGLGQIIGQSGKYKPSPKAPISGLFYVGCDAGAYGIGTQQAVESGIHVADLVYRYHQLHRVAQ